MGPFPTPRHWLVGSQVRKVGWVCATAFCFFVKVQCWNNKYKKKCFFSKHTHTQDTHEIKGPDELKVAEHKQQIIIATKRHNHKDTHIHAHEYEIEGHIGLSKTK